MITHAQRVKAAKEGRILDRPAFVAWGPHMSLVDRNVKDFTEATIAYENSYQFDFIKLMSNGMYFTEDFGQKIKPASHIMDDTWLNVSVNAVNDPHEWAKLKAPDVKKGALAREVEVCKRLCDYYQGDVPVLPTIFSPFIWMGEMTGGYFRQETIVAHFKYSEKYCRPALEMIAETNEKLMEEFIAAGASGFFFGYQCGMAKLMGKEMFEKFGKKYDIQNIEAIKSKTWFNMAHVCHGDAETSEWFLDYPVDAFNWTDQDPAMYSLGEMRKRTDKVLIGGLLHSNEFGYRDPAARYMPAEDFKGDNRDKVKAHIKDRVLDALKQSGLKTIVSGGCGWNEGSLPRFGLWREVMEEVGDEIKKGIIML